MSVSRFSVPLVCGTRLNTPRSLSVMRSVTTIWLWADTAETPAMPWRRQSARPGAPTGKCSAPRTATMTFLNRETVRQHTAAAGGLDNVRRTSWTMSETQSGRPARPFTMYKQVTCWWKLTSQQPPDFDVYGNTNPSNINGLKILNNKILRILQKTADAGVLTSLTCTNVTPHFLSTYTS